jgi:hypothetical protein
MQTVFFKTVEWGPDAWSLASCMYTCVRQQGRGAVRVISPPVVANHSYNLFVVSLARSMVIRLYSYTSYSSVHLVGNSV